ncbi:hypothetical protein JZU68_00510, partial [bacterium]|nr:hypothetical protein [bacterium]
MAEVYGLEDLPKIYEFYSLTSGSKSHFQVGLSMIGSSNAFTSKISDTFSPAHTYFSNNIINKLKQFPTMPLHEIADVQRSSLGIHMSGVSAKAKTSHKIISARNLTKDSTIDGSTFREVTKSDIDRFQLRANDILIRAIQTSSKPSGGLKQSEAYDEEGMVTAIVPPELEGALFDQSLIRIRIKDNLAVRVTPEYMVQLFRNKFVISGFNQIVLEQITSSASSLSNFTYVAPSQ